jgi:hypothetical protein
VGLDVEVNPLAFGDFFPAVPNSQDKTVEQILNASTRLSERAASVHDLLIFAQFLSLGTMAKVIVLINVVIHPSKGLENILLDGSTLAILEVIP